MSLTRRRFLKRLFWSTAALGVGGVMYPAFIEPQRVEVVRVRLALPHLSRPLDGLRIVQMSDLHRSRLVSADYLRRCVTIANTLAPDLIVFTGDYLTHARRASHSRELIYGKPEAAADLALEAAECAGQARAKHGVFASLGNHDHWYDGDAVTNLLRKAGVTVLRNESAHVAINGERLPIVGLGDLWTEGVNIGRAFADVNAPFTLVLMHNPDTFEDWRRAGTHLILSGHTHGGQVNLPLLGPPIVPSLYGQRYAHGLFRRDNTYMYVNRGLGMIYPPVRFNCRPEITAFDLHCA